jgi:hypothetical protein
MRKEKIISEQEKVRKINFLINLGYTLEESNQMYSKILSCYSYLYWMYKDKSSEEEAKIKVSNIQRLRSPICIEYWIHKYKLSEEEAKIKVSDIQKLRSPRCVEYWINRGLGLEDAKIKVSEHQDKVSFREGQNIEDYLKKCENRRINKEKYIKLYGDELGIKKWNDKKEKSKITLDNMIRLYGDELGETKWNNYIERQRISQSEPKLIEKHGLEKANKIIQFRKNLNKLCVDKYKQTGNTKYISKTYSKSSQNLFWSIYNKLPENIKSKCYFKELNNEFVLILNSGLCYQFDFVISNINFCIEFNGDMWHANPQKYNANDYIFEKKAYEIWNSDEKKIKTLKEMRNIDTIIIWESNWKKNKLEVEKDLIDIINKRFNDSVNKWK